MKTKEECQDCVFFDSENYCHLLGEELQHILVCGEEGE